MIYKHVCIQRRTQALQASEMVAVDVAQEARQRRPKVCMMTKEVDCSLSELDSQKPPKAPEHAPRMSGNSATRPLNVDIVAAAHPHLWLPLSRKEGQRRIRPTPKKDVRSEGARCQTKEADGAEIPTAKKAVS